MVEDFQLAAAGGRAFRDESGCMRRIMDWCNTYTAGLGQRMAEVACHHRHWDVYWCCGGEVDRWVFV